MSGESRQLVSLSERINTIGAALEKMKGGMALILPRHLKAEKLIRMAMGACQHNPKLLDCSQKSLLSCIMEAAKLGFEVNSPLHQCSLVPYKIKGVLTCTLIPEYRGLMDLARQSGQVSWIDAQVAYVGEEFEYSVGIDPILRHVPKPDVKRDESTVIAAYAVSRLKDGSTQFVCMWKSEIDGRRARSRASDSGPWVTDYAAMAKKTVIKELCDKRLPRSTELARAIELDTDADIGQAQAFDMDIVADDVTEQEPTAPAKQPAPLTLSIVQQIEELARHMNGNEFDGCMAAVNIEPGTMIETLTEKQQSALLAELQK